MLGHVKKVPYFLRVSTEIKVHFLSKKVVCFFGIPNHYFNLCTTFYKIHGC